MVAALPQLAPNVKPTKPHPKILGVGGWCSGNQIMTPTNSLPVLLPKWHRTNGLQSLKVTSRLRVSLERQVNAQSDREFPHPHSQIETIAENPSETCKRNQP